MTDLKPQDWNTILSALWIAKQKATTFGERQKFLGTYKKVEQKAKDRDEAIRKIIEQND